MQSNGILCGMDLTAQGGFFVGTDNIINIHVCFQLREKQPGNRDLSLFDISLIYPNGL